MAQELRFRSAVGRSFRIAALAVAALLTLSQSNGFNALSLVVLGLSLGFIAWLQTSTVYVVTGHGLRVQSGPSRRWIDAKLIERVRPTTTILAAPALSGDRLEVTGGFGSVVVSPSDQAGFVRALKAVAPQMQLEGSLQALDAGGTNVAGRPGNAKMAEPPVL
jgi:hypothetical protein